MANRLYGNILVIKQLKMKILTNLAPFAVVAWPDLPSTIVGFLNKLGRVTCLTSPKAHLDRCPVKKVFSFMAMPCNFFLCRGFSNPSIGASKI